MVEAARDPASLRAGLRKLNWGELKAEAEADGLAEASVDDAGNSRSGRGLL